MDDDHLAVLLIKARKEGRKAERKAIVRYLRTKGSTVSRVLGNAIEDCHHYDDQ